MENEFEIINDLGQKEKYYIINHFNIDNISYLVYTDGNLDKNGNINTYINEYDINNNKLILKEVKKDSLEMVNKKWEEICQEN